MKTKNTTVCINVSWRDVSQKHLSTKFRTYRGFTLVELIVVITILVILGTIAFTQLSGFSGSARDSSRVSDLANLSKSLDIASLKTGTYPTPDYAFSVTYSGGVLWNQGTIGDTVMNILSAGGARLNKKPTDPLTPTKEYTYSTLAFGNAYQIKTDYEGESVAYGEIPPTPFDKGEFVFSPLSKGVVADRGIFGFDTANAASGNPTLSYIKGNYNGIAAKTQTGNLVYILAVPSLFVNSSTGTVILPTASATGFYLHGQTNSGGIAFTTKLVFSSSSGSLPSTDSERILFASGVANAYSGTILATNSNIASYITALTNNNTGTLATLGGSFVSTSLGGTASVANSTPTITPTTFSLSATSVTAGTSVTITDTCTTHPTSYTSSNAGVATVSVTTITTSTAGTTSITPVGGNCTDSAGKTLTVTAAPNSCAANPSFANLGTLTVGTPTSANQAWTYNASNTGPCTYACIDGYSGNNCATAPWSIAGGGDCTYVDNTLGSDTNTSTCTDNRTYTHVGAGATHSKTYNLLKIAGKWWFNQNLAYPPATGYQGSNTWSASDLGYYSCPGTNSTTTVDCASVSTLGYLYQWSAATGVASNNNDTTTLQGICPTGWHIPKKSDFSTASSTYWPDPASDNAWLGATTGWTRSYVGYRSNDASGTFYTRTTYEHVWSSFESSAAASWYENFNSSNPTQSYRDTSSKANGFSVRCLKN